MIQVAWAMLILWPLISIVFYKNLSLPVALITTLLGGYLLLPSKLELDLPLLPALNKHSISVMTAAFLTAWVIKSTPKNYVILPGWIPKYRAVQVFLVLFVVGAFGTVLTNSDQIVYGSLILPSIRPYDVVADLIGLAFLVIPIFLGRKVLSGPEGQRLLLKALVISGIVYSFPILYEIRMSPQLHVDIYGFFPTSFVQQIRAGGFRPVVFLPHGLHVGIFLATCLVAAAALTRVTDKTQRVKYMFAMLWLF